MIMWNVRDADEKENVGDTLREIIDVIREINAAMRIVCNHINDKDGESSE